MESDGTASESNAGMQAALLNALNLKPPKELVQFDMSSKLSGLGLLTHFPPEVWPQQHAVRELATKIRAREKLGETNPFIYADLHRYVTSHDMSPFLCCCLQRFVPVFCPELVKVTLDVEANEKMDRTAKKRLDPTVWLLAWDAYALAAAATGQVT